MNDFYKYYINKLVSLFVLVVIGVICLSAGITTALYLAFKYISTMII